MTQEFRQSILEAKKVEDIPLAVPHFPKAIVSESDHAHLHTSAKPTGHDSEGGNALPHGS